MYPVQIHVSSSNPCIQFKRTEKIQHFQIHVFGHKGQCRKGRQKLSKTGRIKKKKSEGNLEKIESKRREGSKCWG